VSLAKPLHLPRAAPARVLACGAFLKNTAGLLLGDRLWLSPPHGDLADPAACRALEDSVQCLLTLAGHRIDAVAHDLHPDFHGTRLAQRLAAELGVPAIAVQHHHAHIAVVQAEQGLGDEPLVGLALDGVGLGHDGQAWGGEVLQLRGARCQRVAHLPQLAMPGGDIAAREPWRLAAAVLHALGRGDEIVPRFGPRVGDRLAAGVAHMLARGLQCPATTAAGRWFDAAAGVLRLSVRQQREAEAARAVERRAADWLAQNPAPRPITEQLLPLLGQLFDRDPGEGAAQFHVALSAWLVQAAQQAAASAGASQVVLAGGCFFNALLSAQVRQGLQAAGLQVLRPASPALGCGDAGLPLGQAWAAALQLESARAVRAPALET